MTSVRRLDSTAFAYTGPMPGQKSHANAFDRAGRGRSRAAHRRVQVAPVITRHEATVFWSDLMRRRLPSREACAVAFGVTFQTACNWWDGFSCPTGDKVMMAMRLWPEEFEVSA